MEVKSIQWTKSYKAKIVSARTKTNAEVYNGEILLVLEFTSKDGKQKRIDFTSPFEGTVKKIYKNEGEIISHKDYLFDIEICNHDVQINNLCAICGADLSVGHFSKRQVVLGPQKKAQEKIQMDHNLPSLLITQKEAKKIEHENATKLLARRKLSLVLDLDLTLLHAVVLDTAATEVFENSDPKLQTIQSQIHNQPSDLHLLTLPHPPFTKHLVKFRPGLDSFLQKLSPLFQFHIYTFGSRSYAEQIARILDPTRTLR
eukprot:TRINITY_DN10345_c0_g1_i1.p1 TRINITY_DN10345_c0_g1~~TRINITY_DN10345_c0_g1_i1.p1  ORF type:complete len:258 (-),score=73.91 TRINITY_DN10345_c0_g1_i1:5-778(-)